MTEALNALLAPVQADFAKDPEFQKVAALAYPAPVPEKKAKKEKKIGTGYVAKGKKDVPAAAAAATGAAVAPIEAAIKKLDVAK